MGWRHQYAGLEKLELPGLTVYLVDSEQYFGDKIYYVEAPEGELKFVPFEMDKKKDGKPMKWDVADLEEVD